MTPPRAANEGQQKAASGRVATTRRRAALHDEAVNHLRRMILDGDLAPGSRVPERDLCAALEISRTPLREALKVLASEGLVQLMPHRGATITKLSPQDLDHAFRVVEALEALAGELASERITDDEIAQIRALHGQMVAYYENGARPEYFRLNQAIHDHIVAAAGNPILSEMHANLSRRIQQARYMPNYSTARWRQAVEDHEQMLEALEARDSERLARVLRHHLWRRARSEGA